MEVWMAGCMHGGRPRRGVAPKNRREEGVYTRKVAALQRCIGCEALRGDDGKVRQTHPIVHKQAAAHHQDRSSAPGVPLLLRLALRLSRIRLLLVLKD